MRQKKSPKRFPKWKRRRSKLIMIKVDFKKKDAIVRSMSTCKSGSFWQSKIKNKWNRSNLFNMASFKMRMTISSNTNLIKALVKWLHLTVLDTATLTTWSLQLKIQKPNMFWSTLWRLNANHTSILTSNVPSLSAPLDSNQLIVVPVWIQEESRFSTRC